MRFARSVAAGALLTGAAAGFALAGAGAASAVGVSPLPGGVQVDLNHDETVWAHQNGVGQILARIPNPSAQSFGSTLTVATALSSQYPGGHVTFTVFGPITAPSGEMVAFKE